MQVQTNLSQEEINEQSKSWATIFGCVAAIALAISFTAAHFLH